MAEWNPPSVPTDDWGQAAVNNGDTGFGAGALNSPPWGMIHEHSYGHAITNLVGGGALPFTESLDFSLTKWSQLPETGVVHTANEVQLLQANSDVILFPEMFISGDFDIYFVATFLNSPFPLGSTFSTGNYIGLGLSVFNIKIDAGSQISYPVDTNALQNSIVHFARRGDVGELFINKVSQGSQVVDTGLFRLDTIGERKGSFSNLNMRWLYIPQYIELQFNLGVGTIAYDNSGYERNATLSSLAVWNTGVDTPIAAVANDPLRYFLLSIITDDFVDTKLQSNVHIQALRVLRTHTNQLATVVDYYDVILNGETIKTGGDDSAPYRAMTATIGANHGYSKNKITAVAHGKTWADMGSIYNDGTVDVVLVNWGNEDVLYIAQKDSNGWFSGTTLTHVSGGTNTGDIVITDSENDFMHNSIQNQTISTIIDGQKELAVNGLQNGDVIAIEDKYEIMTHESIIDYLIANVGSIEFNEVYTGVSVIETDNTTKFFEKGFTIDANFRAIEAILLRDIMFTQSTSLIPTGGHINPELYVPKSLPFTQDAVNYDFANIQDATIVFPNRIDFTPDRMDASGMLGDRALSLLSDIGMAIGYLPIYDADPSVRRANATVKALQLNTSKKIYMSCIDKGSYTTAVNETHRAITYRVFFERQTNRTAYYTVPYGNDSYLYLDYHNLPYVDSVELAADLQGKTHTLIEKSSNLTYVDSGATLDVTITNALTYGYLILKLS